MAFDFDSFFRFVYRALLERQGNRYRLTPRRFVLFVGAWCAYALFEAAVWSGYLLDDILFRDYRRQKVGQPVFIVGNPRSGTTFLYNVLAQDTHNFLCARTWESVFAPSIVARKVYQALAVLDGRLGRPLQRQIAVWEERVQQEVSMHKFALDAPEEDEHFFLHACSAIEIWLFSTLVEDAIPLTFFDSMLSGRDRERIMGYYVQCVQRHLYAHRADLHPGRRYLAKNPYSSAKVGSLYRRFPGAKFIYLARNPLDMIPSWINSVAYAWRLVDGVPDVYGSRDFVLDLAEHWYRYPLKCFETAPRDSYIVIKFDDLVSDVEGTVRDIYDRFGLDLAPSFVQVVQKAAESSRRYRSRHKYNLEQMGLTREQIVDRLKDVFARFGFDTREPASEMDAKRHFSAGMPLAVTQAGSRPSSSTHTVQP